MVLFNNPNPNHRPLPTGAIAMGNVWHKIVPLTMISYLMHENKIHTLFYESMICFMITNELERSHFLFPVLIGTFNHDLPDRSVTR